MNLVVEKATATKSIRQWVKAGLIIAISGRKSHLDPPKSSAQPGGAIKCTVDFFFKMHTCTVYTHFGFKPKPQSLKQRNRESSRMKSCMV